METHTPTELTKTIARVQTDSKRICYIILPEGNRDDLLQYIDTAASKFDCTLVILAGLNWNDDLTPWPAAGVFKEKKPFGGRASDFLESLLSRYIPEIEREQGLHEPERFIVGISLSGLFTLWALTKTDVFSGAACISGSLWYDGLTEYLQKNPIKQSSVRIHLSLGDREKNSKDERMRTVQTCTEEIVSILTRQGAAVDYRLVDGTHFSPIVPRLDMALESILSRS